MAVFRDGKNEDASGEEVSYRQGKIVHSAIKTQLYHLLLMQYHDLDVLPRSLSLECFVGFSERIH